jgi:chromosome condensin MukBEF ATPase and DNA-binding subunit MukB
MRKDDVTDNERAENFFQAKYEELCEITKNDQIEMMSLRRENDELRERINKLASRIPAWPKNYRPARPRKFM